MKVSLHDLPGVSYSFDPVAKQVIFSGFGTALKPSNIWGVINSTRNRLIYRIDDALLGGSISFSGGINTLSLVYDTSSMLSTDDLSIVFDLTNPEYSATWGIFQGALDEKADKSDTYTKMEVSDMLSDKADIAAFNALQDEVDSHVQITAGNPHGTTKNDIGLGNVNNTSDTDKPISAATQTALDSKADLVGGKVPSSQLPSYVDDVVEISSFPSMPATGESGKIYITIDDNKAYRWSGSTYININPTDLSNYFTKSETIYEIGLNIKDTTGLIAYYGDNDIPNELKRHHRVDRDGVFAAYGIDSYESLGDPYVGGIIEIDVFVNGTYRGTCSMEAKSDVYNDDLSSWTSLNISRGDLITYFVTNVTDYKNIVLTLYY